MQVVRNAPLVAIDLIVMLPDQRVLLGQRSNRPAQGCWFVPGGRIRKGESLDAAFERVTLSELGEALPRSRARLLGAFDHFYEDNFGGGAGFGTHYVSLGHLLCLSRPPAALPLDQHSGYRWSSIAELLTSDDVHTNTKRFFEHFNGN